MSLLPPSAVTFSGRNIITISEFQSGKFTSGGSFVPNGASVVDPIITPASQQELNQLDPALVPFHTGTVAESLAAHNDTYHQSITFKTKPNGVTTTTVITSGSDNYTDNLVRVLKKIKDNITVSLNRDGKNIVKF